MDPTRSLLSGIIDYAGLFPPAKLSMADATSEYAACRSDPASWMLAAFVVPAERLEEFEACAGGMLPADGEGQAWPLSVLVGPDWQLDLDSIAAFTERHSEGSGAGRAEVVAVETKPVSEETLRSLASALPQGIELFVEIDWRTDPAPWISVVLEVGARAKIRTGGVQPAAIPASENIVAFLRACAAAPVGLKFTAGLHHPVRSEHALTYESDAPRAAMHGFLNAFIAAALVVRGGVEDSTLIEVLEDENPASFAVADDAWMWRDERIEATTLAAVRGRFARSFGSCSFAEPIEDLQSLKIL